MRRVVRCKCEALSAGQERDAVPSLPSLPCPRRLFQGCHAHSPRRQKLEHTPLQTTKVVLTASPPTSSHSAPPAALSLQRGTSPPGISVRPAGRGTCRGHETVQWGLAMHCSTMSNSREGCCLVVWEQLL